MDHHFATPGYNGPVNPEYVKAFDDLERRAARGQLTLAQLRREVHALRERHTGGWPVAIARPDQCLWGLCKAC
jgi:hypothetical protein